MDAEHELAGDGGNPLDYSRWFTLFLSIVAGSFLTLVYFAPSLLPPAPPAVGSPSDYEAFIYFWNAWLESFLILFGGVLYRLVWFSLTAALGFVTIAWVGDLIRATATDGGDE